MGQGMRRSVWLSILVLAPILGGCGPQFGPKAENGITFYAPGAGNFDLGDLGIREGLDEAGYQGQVASVLWTVSFNPAIDQRLGNARLGGVKLARWIEDYADQYPGRPINLIGLSAGTGVAIWALEDLKEGYSVENVVLLGSSLWYRYDISKALRHVNGKIYNYYSSQDIILAGPMKVFGTIDGVFGEDGAGAVGLHPPHDADRVVNIRWEPAFKRYGNYGNHTDGTRAPFVKAYIAKHIISQPTEHAQHDETLARSAEPALPAGHPD
jgi:pimeloyl-ACP methyl ester carboxylesterase